MSIYITHVIGEVLRDNTPAHAKITHALTEVLRADTPAHAKITHVMVEVLREYVPCDWFVEDVEIINWIP